MLNPNFRADRVLLDFEVTMEKKYRLLFHNGSLKEQVPKKSIQVWYVLQNPGYNIELTDRIANMESQSPEVKHSVFLL